MSVKFLTLRWPYVVYYWDFKVTLKRDLPLGTLNMCTKFEKKTYPFLSYRVHKEISVAAVAV